MPKKTKIAYTKNVTILSFTFFLLFTAYMGLEVLQSTLNSDIGNSNIGIHGLITVYSFFIISGLFLPNVVINRFGLKPSIFWPILGYLLFTLANFYPAYYTLLPTGAIVGLCAGVLWVAKASYITTAGDEYAKVKVEREEIELTTSQNCHNSASSETGSNHEAPKPTAFKNNIMGKFFSIFFIFFSATQISGSLRVTPR